MFILSLVSVLLLSVYAINDAEQSADQSNGAPQIFNRNTNPIKEDVDSKCLDCICQTETGCNHTAQCNSDHSICGPFQINFAYYQDCCNFLNLTNCDSYLSFKTCALDYNCAVRCVRAYVNNYGSKCLKAPDCRTYARVHRKGADGCRMSETIQFGNDVMHCYGGADHNPYVLPCTSNEQCPGDIINPCIKGSCKHLKPNPDQNTWFCNCLGDTYQCSGGTFDCCSLNCVGFFGKCTDGGLNGTICDSTCDSGHKGNCAPGCKCVPFGEYSYCSC